MRVLIDEDLLEDGAIDWWKNLSPQNRAVLIQSLWESGHGREDDEAYQAVAAKNNKLALSN